jgi:hypothetical protein
MPRVMQESNYGTNIQSSLLMEEPSRFKVVASQWTIPIKSYQLQKSLYLLNSHIKFSVISFRMRDFSWLAAQQVLVKLRLPKIFAGTLELNY